MAQYAHHGSLVTTTTRIVVAAAAAGATAVVMKRFQQGLPHILKRQIGNGQKENGNMSSFRSF